MEKTPLEKGRKSTLDKLELLETIAKGEDSFTEFKKDIEDPNLPTNTFIETVYYSKKYNKTFLIKSRKLKNDHYPLVYIHITSDVSKRGKNVR